MADEIKESKETALEKKNSKPVQKKEKKPGLFKRLKQWWKETRSELKKVVWPTPKQVVNNTIVVLVVVLLSAVFIGLVDMVFKFAAGLLG